MRDRCSREYAPVFGGGMHLLTEEGPPCPPLVLWALANEKIRFSSTDVARYAHEIKPAYTKHLQLYSTKSDGKFCL
ncbi:hypothetical protein ACOSQ3_015653 [Xanthoceras sorbifolium]